MDPLQNPSPIWRNHYDHRTRAGKWGRLIQKTLRLKTSSDRYMAELRVWVKSKEPTP